MFKSIFIILLILLPIGVFGQDYSSTILHYENKIKEADQVIQKQTKIKALYLDSLAEVKLLKIKSRDVYFQEKDVFAKTRFESSLIDRTSGIHVKTIKTIPAHTIVQLIDYYSGYWKVLVDDNQGYISDHYINETTEVLEFKMKWENRRHEVKESRDQENQLKLSEIDAFKDSIKSKEFAQAKAKKRQEEAMIIEQNKKREETLIKKYGKEIGTNIHKGYYWIGMSDTMAKESLGNPISINKTVGSWGVHEQWVYYNDYLYFENGFLTSYQTTR